MMTPGCGNGTRIIDCCRWRSGLFGSDLPITIRIRQRGFSAPDVHHLRPLITYSPPSGWIDVSMLVASDEAVSGSVIEKPERISPARSGLSQRSFCASVPYRTRTSILPVSGAAQLNASGANGERPMISHSGAYSRLVSPAPRPVSGRNRFQRLHARAFAL